MPPSKPKATPRAPTKAPAVRAVDEAALAAMEAKYRLREAEPAQPSEAASSQARSGASTAVARSGTLEAPYVRSRDGLATRSTTIHLPVEVHQRLRMAATARNARMSQIVAEAVADWLDAHNA